MSERAPRRLREQPLREASNWTEFNRLLGGMAIEKDKGDAFELLTKAYLQLDPKYDLLLNHVWLRAEVPNAVRRKLKLPPDDRGIDLVLQTHDGDYWVVQCKYHEDNDSVDAFFDGRRDDCAENDFSIGLLLTFGDFKYLLAGDLTGDPTRDVADIEASAARYRRAFNS